MSIGLCLCNSCLFADRHHIGAPAKSELHLETANRVEIKEREREPHFEETANCRVPSLYYKEYKLLLLLVQSASVHSVYHGVRFLRTD